MLRRILQACGRAAAGQGPIMDHVPSTSGRSSAAAHLEDVLQEAGRAASLVFHRSKYTYKFKKSAAMPGLVYWAPRTPGLRHKITIDYDYLGVYTGPPRADLSMHVARTGGRNNTGRITCWHHGGGEAKVLRDVDFKRGMDGVPGVVERIEHDPNRTGFLALVRYEPEGQLPLYRYHLAPADLKPGDIMLSGSGAPIRPGNVLAIRDIPLGVPIHNIELRPGGGGQLVRAANCSAVIQAKQEEYAIVRLPSTETRLIPLDCRATVGTVSNHLQKMVNLGKAGESRKRGVRPTVRGYAMNPVDHPHGGRTKGGRPSCSPWGIYAKGKRTRRRNRHTNRFILVRKGNQPIDKFVQAKKWKARVKREEQARSGGQGGGQAKAAAGAGGKKGAGEGGPGGKA